MNASFQIYNASAGSGKTFTLVKEYLKVLFNSPFKDAYKNALAITFTNKAVAEMKVRIIESLKEFSKASILEEPSQIFKDICNELDKKPQDIHIKAGKLLDSIINNYAAFDISTIDKFTQKLIRTFAYDLKLPLNFEVELDTDYLLQKAVNNLIAKAGSEKRLTKILVDFAIEKADDDKSWDVSFDFIKIAKLLINENDIYALNSLRDKTLNDFDSFKKIVIERIGLAEKNIIKQSSTALSLVEEYGLEYSDFSGGSRAYLPNYFLKLEKLETNISYDSAWIKNLEEKPLYPEKSTSDDIKAIIDDIQPELVSIFNNTRTEVFSLLLLKGIYKNLTPLSVLKHINSELEAIKEEQNIILISEFNTIISDHIKKQPAPFIYERIGERFRHYFIDEFQDTSQMQWENLIPLLENSLASENGSALIVGDAKQAIYRWRGGKAEQFINLFSDLNPFYVNKHVEDLPKNFRSSKQVVAFNNAFFKHLSTFAFRDETYSFLYKNAHQEIHQDNQGFVSLEFIEIQNEDDKREIYAQQTLKTIQNCLENGYNLQDLCVLVRYGKDGVTISEYLSKNGIDIISSETLLIKNAPEIKFIIQLLECISEPDNKLSKIKALNYLLETKLNIDNKHSILERYKDSLLDVFFKDLEEFNFYFNLNEFSALPFYEAIELIIYSFKLAPKSNAYIQFFLDFVLEFSEKTNPSLNAFLEHFHLKEDNLSIISPEGNNAVQIMTIHKAKGLEFPVVIFPFADLNIYYSKNDNIWFPLDSEEFNAFEYALIGFNKSIESMGEIGNYLYHKTKAEKELDNINLLYVALTRAIEQLHIISHKDLDSKNNEKLNNFSGLFINYLKDNNLWEDHKTHYTFGDAQKTTKTEEYSNTKKNETLISVPKKQHQLNIVTASGYLWDTHQEEAIEKGNLIHLILSKIKTKHDIPFVFKEFLNAGQITQDQESHLKPLILKTVEHPKLKTYFSTDSITYNEHDIISNSGKLIRPDKLVILPKNKAVLIDYKTGAHEKIHIQQLEEYQEIIEEMDFNISMKILVYINNEIDIKEV